MYSGTSAIPPAIETIIGFAYSFNASAIADARAKWPIPTPLLVARIIVGFSITIGSLGDTPELLA